MSYEPKKCSVEGCEEYADVIDAIDCLCATHDKEKMSEMYANSIKNDIKKLITLRGYQYTAKVIFDALGADALIQGFKEADENI